eukprot:SAG11_NODE_2122_length_3784_cov_3.569878_7_plen_101_part_00
MDYKMSCGMAAETHAAGYVLLAKRTQRALIQQPRIDAVSADKFPEACHTQMRRDRFAPMIFMATWQHLHCVILAECIQAYRACLLSYDTTIARNRPQNSD